MFPLNGTKPLQLERVAAPNGLHMPLNGTAPNAFGNPPNGKHALFGAGNAGNDGNDGNAGN